MADAEDMVQETYVRWHQTATTDVRSPKAWLGAVITSLCINHLGLARVQREQYVGPWLPEPLASENSTDPRENAQLADSLSLAFLVVLETLSPTERAVFLLREVFDFEFDEISRIVEKSETNCRQLLSRARQHIVKRRPRFDTSSEATELVLQQFLSAAATGNVQGLLAVLA